MSGSLTFHGGRIGDACARFGGAPGDWLDLSTGINPRPWPLSQAPRPDWHVLPDPQVLARLEAVAAAFFGVDPALCCATGGSETGLRALVHLLRLPGLCRPLTYSTHAQAFEHAQPVGSLQDLPGTPSVLVLANPNNPDGHVTSRADLLAALARQEAHGGWLILDEAFADCQPDWSLADCVADGRKLIVTRSFGKFFGLAGVRLGFVLGPAAVLAGLRKLIGEWPVSAAALAFGTAAYADSRWIAETRETLPAMARRMDALFAHYGLHAVGACPLFRLVETSAAPQLFEALVRHHILTRPFARHPQLLRFGLAAGDAERERLDTALAAAHG